MPTERWTVGDVTITKVVESESWLPAEFLAEFLPGSLREDVEAMQWLAPHYLYDGQVSLGIYSFLVETPDRKLVIDTAVGNAKSRVGPAFNMLDTTFLDDFRRVWEPQDVDAVVSTHLHVDHVGWNTRLVDGEWLPTFANAVYYFVDREYRHWEQCAADDQPHPLFDAAAVFADSLRPIADAGQAEFIVPSAQLTPEVALIPSHGHTPGHVSVLVQSRGESAVITGDLVHFPCQIGHPDWSSVYDHDAVAAAATRTAFLERFADTDTLVIGTHFGTPTGVFAQRDGAAFRLTPAGTH
jgi:glyoxylase-like metal-dependent hydrolase (beta-lactamase superfamily II)